MINAFKKIMIVDDDSVDRWILRRTLEKMKITETIIESQTGAEALAVITNYSAHKEELPELIFLDLHMPVLNGFEFLDALEQLSREYKNRCRIAVVSSIESESDKNKSLGYESVIGYFEKPVKEETILRMREQLNFNQAC